MALDPPGERLSDAAPVFVYGALRSGTTLFRLMLNAHPALFNPGEVDYLFDHLHRDPDGRWRYDLEALSLDRSFGMSRLGVPERSTTDGRGLFDGFMAQLGSRGVGRMSLNVHRNLGKIAALFPDARIVHLLRDPRDVARSCIGMGWAGTVYYGSDPWIGTEQAWNRDAAAFPLEHRFELTYEALIADPSARLREVCVFLGIEFDPAMLDYHEDTTYGPPDQGMINQWRNRLDDKDLALLEGKLGALLVSRGYAPSGVPPRLPSRLERTLLHWENKTAVWRFAVSRYGIGLVVAEKLSRWLGLTAWNRRMRIRINKDSEQYLK